MDDYTIALDLMLFIKEALYMSVFLTGEMSALFLFLYWIDDK